MKFNISNMERYIIVLHSDMYRVRWEAIRWYESAEEIELRPQFRAGSVHSYNKSPRDVVVSIINVREQSGGLYPANIIRRDI